MRIKTKTPLIAIILIITLTLGCINTSQSFIVDTNQEQQPQVQQQQIPSSQIQETSQNSTIKLSAFNIQVFGKTKASKPDVMEILSNTIKNFDIVAVQEIRDVSQTSLPLLRDTINSNGVNYDYIVSERLGRTKSKEQYAYIYNKDTIELIGTPYTYPDPNDIFHREPYIANFKSKKANFDFILITIHTDPDEAIQEINNLSIVVEDTKKRYQDEGDFIVMGDLNADCSYFNEGGQSPLKNNGYTWLIDNSIDTTTKPTNCTYDRIIITSPVISDYAGDSGVFRYDVMYNLTYEETIEVSDHYPVFAEFWNNKDED